MTLRMLNVDVRLIWLWHLPLYWSAGLNQLIWLARQVPPLSLTALRASLLKQCTELKRKTFPNRRGPFSSIAMLSWQNFQTSSQEKVEESSFQNSRHIQMSCCMWQSAFIKKKKIHIYIYIPYCNILYFYHFLWSNYSSLILN